MVLVAVVSLGVVKVSGRSIWMVVVAVVSLRVVSLGVLSVWVAFGAALAVRMVLVAVVSVGLVSVPTAFAAVGSVPVMSIWMGLSFGVASVAAAPPGTSETTSHSYTASLKGICESPQKAMSAMTATMPTIRGMNQVKMANR